MRQSALWWLSAALMPGIVVVAARAQPPEAAGAGASSASAELVRRVVHVFDFEERQRGNFEAMPMHWFRVGGVGYPNYTTIELDKGRAHAGEFALKLQLNGGSAAVVLEPGVIPAVPQARYMIDTRVRTEAATHSRARLAGVFLNQRGEFIERSLTVSTPAISNDGWAPVQIHMPPAPDDAAWLILRLELLQPLMYSPSGLGPHELLEQDLKAAAWFDDVTVYQLPRVELVTQSGVNIVRLPGAPALTAAVEDLTGEQLTAAITVRDAAGAIVDQQVRPLRRAEPAKWTWEPKLPRLGWYSAEMQVSADEGVVARAATAMLWLPPLDPQSTRDLHRFMISASGALRREQGTLTDLLDQIGPQAVMLPVLHARMDAAAMKQTLREADPLIAQLMAAGRPVALSIHSLPPGLAAAAGTDVDRPLDLFTRDPASWQDTINGLLAMYGHQVRQWQIGPIDGGEAVDQPKLGEVYADLAAHFQRYVADAAVTLPWPALHDLHPDAAGVRSWMIHLPTSIRPLMIPGYAETWPRDPVHVSYALATLPPGVYSHEDRATDLALRMLYAWQSEPKRLVIEQPWSYAASSGAGAMVTPDPLLGVWCNVAQQLAGRRFVGELNLGPGIRAHLLDAAAPNSGGSAERGGVLVIWQEGGEAPGAELDLYLGRTPVAVDIHGNREPLPRDRIAQKLVLSGAPLFIEGVDVPLAMLRAGFSVAPGFVPSTHARHDHEMTLVNPFPQTVTGRLRFVGPERWDIQPRVHNFAIPAGGTLKLPISFTFPINELAGEKLLTADVEIDADERYDLKLQAPMTVGLEGVHYQASVAIESGADAAASGKSPRPATAGTGPNFGADVVVTAIITNTGEADQSFHAFAMARGFARQERIISAIKPGQSITKRFRFSGAAAALSGGEIRLGLRQVDGPAVLNHVVTVPQSF